MLTDAREREEFRHATEVRLFRYHWILPHIGGGLFTQKTKAHLGGSRMWYSVLPNPDPRARHKERFIWGQASYVEGRPPPIPDFVSWNLEEWKTWLANELERVAQDQWPAGPRNITRAE